jgi:hypothetical protein
MAFLIKNVPGNRVAGAPGRNAVVNQWIQVSRPALALPQTATQQLFRVYGGRVLVHLLVGEVTTVIEGTDPVAKISYAALTNAAALVGTAYDIASTLDMSSDEVGTLYGVEGDGTAITSGNQVAGSLETVGTGFVAAQGQIYLTTGASKTGAIKWDLWYQPLDSGGYVEPVVTAVAAIT